MSDIKTEKEYSCSGCRKVYWFKPTEPCNCGGELICTDVPLDKKATINIIGSTGNSRGSNKFSDMLSKVKKAHPNSTIDSGLF